MGKKKADRDKDRGAAAPAVACALFDVPVPTAAPGEEAELARLSAALDARLSGHRLVHSHGVSDTAGRLAALYGVDPFRARAAGLLHDWDKKLPVDELWSKVERYGIDLHGLQLGDAHLVPLLHGWTAAASLPEEFPELPAEVFRAVDRHTVGTTDMSPLDMVVYCADLLEPTRTGDGIDALRALAGSCPLAGLFAACARHGLTSVLAAGRYLYPGGVEVWNACCADLPDACRAEWCRIPRDRA